MRLKETIRAYWREVRFKMKYKRVELLKMKGGGYVGALYPRWGGAPMYSPRFAAKGSVFNWLDQWK